MRFLLLMFFFSSISQASYRAYRLKVTHYNAFGKVVRTEWMISTLDPYQYEHYHSGYRWDRVEMADTWYCPGDTSGKGVCKKPNVRETDYTSDKEKRISLPYTRQPIIP